VECFDISLFKSANENSFAIFVLFYYYIENIRVVYCTSLYFAASCAMNACNAGL